MKNSSRQSSDPKPNGQFKTRLIIIGVSLAAFAAALTIFLLLDLGETDESQASVGTLRSDATKNEVQEPSAPKHVPGRVILRMKEAYRAQCGSDKIQIPQLETLFQNFGVTRVAKNFPKAEVILPGQSNNQGQAMVDLSLIYEIQFDTSRSAFDLAKLANGHPAVMYAEPQYIYDVMYSPSDPYLEYQWYVDSMHVREAWDSTRGDSNIVIGIVDTGTSFAHDELGEDRVALNMNDPIDGIDNDNDGFVDNYRGWDFGGNSFWDPADNNPNYVGTQPGMDHGVLVTGVACAKPDNEKGIAGVGYHTKYLPLKASVDASLGISYGWAAIQYAADHNVPIVNLSWGSGSYSQYGQDVCNYAAINKGVLLVAASGNTFTENLIYPASYDNVISVAASQIYTPMASPDNSQGVMAPIPSSMPKLIPR
ncbi:MAG: S8 family serine peptidase, partial [Bacteroidota bacterium]